MNLLVRSEFISLKVDSMSKSHLIQRTKQDFIKEYVTFFFSEQRQGAFIRAGMLIRIDAIFYTTTTQNQRVTGCKLQ